MKQIIARTIIITMAVVPLLLLPSIRAMQFEIPDSKESGAESEQEPESDENVTTKDASRPDADEQEEAGSEEEQRAVSNGSTEEDDIEESDAATGGRIEGRVVDRETGAPLSGVAVVVEDTDFGTITNNEGNYTIEGVPEGEYKLSFVKSGYIESNVTDVGVEAEETEVLDFGLPPRPAEMSDEVYDLQDFTVTSEEASEMMVNLDIRMESDSIIDMLSSEDLSRFADSDVGSAVKRVAGVSVQDGKFAVIRGLEERYSSTLFNGVPVPSPDPERQSVPLDLFPSEIVKNLSVTKTFEVDQPSNSAGGTIDIRSDVYPEELTIKGTVGGGINENSQDVFLEPSQSRESIDFDNIEDVDARALQGFGGAPVERSGSDTIEHDFDIEIGDTREVFGKTVRYLGSLAFDKDFDTKLGIEHPRKARPSDVADGEIQNLGFSKPRFDVTESASEEQLTGLFSTELDLDDEANHTVGYTGFFTRTEEEFAALRDNGRFPGLVPEEDFGTDIDRWREIQRQFGNNSLSVGSEFQTAVEGELLDFPAVSERVNFWEEASLFDFLVFEEERALRIHQLSGSHEFLSDREDALHFSWAGSLSETTQEENDIFRVGGLELPENSGGGFETGAVPSGFDGFNPDRSWRRIEEDQEFVRADMRYESKGSGDWSWETGAGLFSESTERDTEQFFTGVSLGKLGTNGSFPTLEETIAGSIGSSPSNDFDPAAVALGERDSEGFYLRGKTSFREKLDFVLGARVESFQMSTGTNAEGETFFNSGLLQDTDDDPTNSSTPNAALRNTEILGINGGLPLEPGFQGEIDEDKVFPTASVTYRSSEDMRITAAYSRTNVRPSFKEFTFITVRNPETLTLESGNPTLTTSDVDSVDLRIDKTFNDKGDRASVALFFKSVDEPIEKTNLSDTDIFFNNPNRAEIKGIEIEGRKFLAGMGPEWLDYFSVGGNVTFIDATVDVPETFRDRLKDKFGIENPDKSRRLFGQPEWLVNFDIGFEHPDWGTQATLSLFAQSDVLDTSSGFDGANVEPDLFVSSFEELNFSLRQRLTERLSLKFTAKNLTDSKRGREYAEGSNSPEREFRVGREYGLSITGSF